MHPARSSDLYCIDITSAELIIIKKVVHVCKKAIDLMMMVNGPREHQTMKNTSCLIEIPMAKEKKGK
jgi:hypothetical protein